VENLKGLILSGGKGTRLRPITYTSAKQLVPVANKPVLFYGIEALAAAGIDEIGIIIAPETGGEIRGAAGDGSRFGVKITYIEQHEPLGLAHAVLTAEPFLSGSPFVMYLGDNLLRDGVTDLVETFRTQEPEALILLTPVHDPENYGVAELDGDGRVARLVEKPPSPESNLALVGVYMFTPAIFEAARSIKPSGRNELEITDAIQWLVNSSLRVDPHVVSGWWKDTGQPADMLEANRLVLEELDAHIDGEVSGDSRIESRIAVEQGAVISSSVVRGPAIIGEGARIVDSFIGPYTSIGAGVEVTRSEVENSILLAGARVSDLGTRLEASLLGRNVNLTRSNGMPQTLRMMVGDDSEIELI
jgi:glucose-1-phosphate thymidylyltransferase